jgi:hypothetical protein
MVPIGYNQMMRLKNRGTLAHSAAKEAEIQKIAELFDSPLIHVFRVGETITHNSFEMEEVVSGDEAFIPMNQSELPTEYMNELCRFTQFMDAEGYFIRMITAVYSPPKLKLFDFSLVGEVSSCEVSFPDLGRRSLDDTINFVGYSLRLFRLVSNKSIE